MPSFLSATISAYARVERWQRGAAVLHRVPGAGRETGARSTAPISSGEIVEIVKSSSGAMRPAAGARGAAAAWTALRLCMARQVGGTAPGCGACGGVYVFLAAAFSYIADWTKALGWSRGRAFAGGDAAATRGGRGGGGLRAAARGARGRRLLRVAGARARGRGGRAHGRRRRHSTYS